MFSLYLFALAVGGALLLFSLIGAGGDHDVHVDHGAHGDNPIQWLSLRTVTYFLFVFGGIGAVLSKSWSAGTMPFVLALSLGAGAGVAALVATAFNFLRQTSSGDHEGDESFLGLSGRVVVPFTAGGTGKVLVTRGDRTFELLARPLDTARTDLASWKSVVVVEMKLGTAIVAPSDDPAVKELASLNP